MRKIHEAAVRHALATVHPSEFGWYPCGFAEVRMPGNTKYARALARAGIITKVYSGTGMRFRFPVLSQSMDYKAALCNEYVREVAKQVPDFGGYVWTHID